MKYAVEIEKSGLDPRNLVDLLHGTGYQVVNMPHARVLYNPEFDRLKSPSEALTMIHKLKDIIQNTGIDGEFFLGAVFDYSSEKTAQYISLEEEIIATEGKFNESSLTVLAPSELSKAQKESWKNKHREREYETKLRSQRVRLKAAIKDPRVSRVLTLLSNKSPTGETLYKAYEIMEEHPSKRQQFHSQFNIPVNEFKRFGDTVHNQAVSGELARHAYKEKPKTTNPMTFNEATRFIEELANSWILSIAK